MRYVKIALLQEGLHSLRQVLNRPARLDFGHVELCRLLAVALQVLRDELGEQAAQLSVELLPLLEFLG